MLATTNRNLREEVAAGRFREDLFYRLNVFPISIPSLRNRRDDIVPIAKQLLQRHLGKKQAVILDETAVKKLLQHDWPGNVRELDNTIQRALILKNADTIFAEDIQYETVNQSYANMETQQTPVDDKSVLVSDLKDREQQLILDALNAGSGSRKYAAEKLGISPRTLRYKLARMRDNGVSIPG